VPGYLASRPADANGGELTRTAPPLAPVSIGPVRVAAPERDESPSLRGGPRETADIPVAPEEVATTAAVASGARNRGWPHAAEPAGLEGSAVAPPVVSAAPVLLALLRWSGGEVGADGDAVPGAGAPESPKKGPVLLGPPNEPAANIGAAALPPGKGLLVEGAALGVTAVGRAVGALVEPMLSAGSGSTDLLFWLGVSSWVAAAALACEGARRCWLRRPAQPAPALGQSEFGPETEP
jgi:hypothetical protein